MREPIILDLQEFTRYWRNVAVDDPRDIHFSCRAKPGSACRLSRTMIPRTPHGLLKTRDSSTILVANLGQGPRKSPEAPRGPADAPARSYCRMAHCFLASLAAAALITKSHPRADRALLPGQMLPFQRVMDITQKNSTS